MTRSALDRVRAGLLPLGGFVVGLAGIHAPPVLAEDKPASPSSSPSIAAASEARLDARVARALEFSSLELVKLVANQNVAFNWIGEGDSFWFRRTEADGSVSHVLVTSATGAQQPLFDATALRSAMARLEPAPASGPSAAMTVISVDASGRSMVVRSAASGASFRCDLPVTACTALPAIVEAVSPSPDGRRVAFVREHDLWVRDLGNGSERRLTSTGQADFAYGAGHDQPDFGRVARRRANAPAPLRGVFWSPRGRHIAALRYDLRETPQRLVVTEYLPPEGGYPIAHSERIAIASDPKLPDARIDLIDVETGEVRPTDVDPQGFTDIAQLAAMYGQPAHWTGAEREVYFLTASRSSTEARLVRLDVASGKATDVIVEKSRNSIYLHPTAGGTPNIWISPAGDEGIWYSERSGYGHLYLYDLRSGNVRRQLTKGPWVVADLLRVDADSRTLYFTACGREAGRNPYYRHLYSVSLDGGAPRLLTPENAEHNFGMAGIPVSAPGGSISPNGRFVLDAFSTTQQPDKVLLRRIDGTVIAPVSSADISRLTATGWRPPEEFAVKAADGTTDLHGVIIKPRDFDPSRRYPVIDVSYPGPWSRFLPLTFADNFLASTTLNAHAFAEAGAVVVGVEGRGGGYRSAAFRNAFQYTDDPLGGSDHVAAIRNLAATRPYFDLDRVGATGHSLGGFSTLNAMLRYPDFFKVVVSGEGPGDWSTMQMQVSTERYFGVPDGPSAREYYRRISNVSLADRLKGKLLLILAGEDENVPFFSGLQTIAALQKQGKLFDTVIMPQSAHYGGRHPYGVMRTVRFLAEHLGEPRAAPDR